MMVASAPLSDTLQGLIDARLDTIDRMLVGRVNRQDRLAIVREVETQIHELLGERDANSLDRDDILAVLARLDPPEAYLPDESIGEARTARSTVAPARSQPSRPPSNGVSKTSGILGLCSTAILVLSILVTIMAWGSASRALGYLIIASSSISFILGIIAVTLAATSRLQNGWSVLGLVTGLLSSLVSLVGTFLLL